MTGLFKIFLKTLAVTCCLLVFPAIIEAGDAAIDVKAHPKVKDSKILLGDIAVLNLNDQAQAKNLAALYIAESPRPGRSLRIRREFILGKLRASGLSLDSLEINSPSYITVTRESQTISREYIQEIVHKYLTRHYPYPDSDWELVKVKAGLFRDLPPGQITHEIELQTSSNPTHLTLIIYFKVNGQAEDRVKVNARIDRFTRAAVAARTIEKGRIITAGDVKSTRININRLKPGAITNLYEAVGLICNRRLRPGQLILSKDLVKESMVKKDDMVTIVAESGRIKVSSLGQAKEDGARGEVIAVLNLNSKKTVMARVVDTNRVEVEF